MSDIINVTVIENVINVSVTDPEVINVTIYEGYGPRGVPGETGAPGADAPQLGETSETAYRGDRGKAAYDFSQGHNSDAVNSHLSAAQKTIATQAASATVNGYVSTDNQTFAGDKTFKDYVTFQDAVTIAGTVATDGPTLGDELLVGGTWTSTGWTGNNTAGWTPVGTLPLSYSAPVELGKYYLVTVIKISATTPKLIDFSLGGSNISKTIGTGTTYLGFQAVSTSGLSVTALYGTSSLTFSVKEITTAALPPIIVKNSSNVAVSEMRASDLYNLYTGIDCGKLSLTGNSNSSYGRSSLAENITGSSNSAFGAYALNKNINGACNVAVGGSASENAKHGNYNCAVGYMALMHPIAGNYNTVVGALAGLTLSSSTIKGNNVFIGYKAGYHTSQAIDIENSIAVGANSYTTASDQVVLGASTITQTILRGVVTVPAITTSVRTVTNANATMLATDYTIRMSTDATGRTVNLSAAVAGQIVIIKKIDSGAGAVTFISTTSCTIDGSTSRSLTTQYDTISLQCVTAGSSAVFDIIT